MLFGQEWFKSCDPFEKYSAQSYFKSELSGWTSKFQKLYRVMKDRLGKTPSDENIKVPHHLTFCPDTSASFVSAY